uniref:RED-like N-terminal domain-containing protein n=1 Tax=Kalanchoe fedtschenkoi TaxID=63787 RepID=A0A7N0V7W7_KALFE
MASGKKSNYKEKLHRRKTTEDKPEDPELPKYRDRAKERREDVNPDYELTELASFHAVAPPGAVDLRSADALKISIENSKYLGGDVEHTHLVKGLDYALLHKVRSEIDKKLDTDNDADARAGYEGGYTQDIPTTVHRSKADCPVPEEMVTVSIDGSVLDRIAKIMSYLRLGSSGKVLKKKKKDKDGKARFATSGTIFEEEEKRSKPEVGMLKNPTERDLLPPPPPLRKDDAKPAQLSVIARVEEDDIFVGEGIDYEVPCKDDMSQSPVIEDMVESPKSKERPSYFDEPAYGPVPPSEPYQQWQQTGAYDALQAQVYPGAYQGEWQDYQYADQLAYPEQYVQQSMQEFEAQTDMNLLQDPHFMTQEEKD